MDMTLSLACMTKTERPSAMHGGVSRSPDRRFSFLSRRTVLLPQRNEMTHAQDTACEMIVASAAPFTPMPSANMNTGSSTMLSTAPIITVFMPTFAKPCAVIKELRPSVICTKIVPRAYMPM